MSDGFREGFLEGYWQSTFGVTLLVVVLFFDNGAGGIERLRERFGDGDEGTMSRRERSRTDAESGPR